MLPELVTSAAALITSIGSFIAATISARRAGEARTASTVAAAEVTPNHGGSLKDSIVRIEAAVGHIAEMQRSHGYQIGELRRDKLQTHEMIADRLSEHGHRLDRLEED